MASILGNKILAADDIKIQAVEVPEWDLTVYLHGLTAAQVGELQKHTLVQRGKQAPVVNLDRFTAWLCFLGIYDETGMRAFDDPKEVDLLASKSADVLNRLGSILQKMSGITKEEQDFLPED